MGTYRTHAQRGGGEKATSFRYDDALDPSAVLGAVRDDIRQTLRVGWLDPALEASATSPVFFTAAWSAVRPSVGKSFLLLARGVRTAAGEIVRDTIDLPDLRKRLDGDLSEEDLHRIEECVRAAHVASAKAQIVVHAFHRAVRRERIAGTGREEPPIRRGVPDWQRWMSFPMVSPAAQPFLEEAGRTFLLPAAPAPLRLFARWPVALEAAWGEVKLRSRTEFWKNGSARLRRLVLGGIGTLPHPVELQWTALKARGFEEADRLRMSHLLAAYDASMSAQTLMAAFLWAAFGAPEIGHEA